MHKEIPGPTPDADRISISRVWSPKVIEVERGTRGVGEPGPAPRPANDAPEVDRRTGNVLPYEVMDDAQVDIKKDWLIKGVAAKGETTAIIGPPGTMKSANALDRDVHLAQGKDWRGYKTKQRCSVLYLAFERGLLTMRRYLAYKRRDGIEQLPIAILRRFDGLNLMDPGSVDILVATIQDVGNRFSLPVGEVTIDTTSKAIAAGGGDENKAGDQNRFRGHLREVQNRTGVHITLLGHTGKDVSRGERGSNASVGDLDVEETITGEDVKTLTVTKANDQDEGLLTSFRAERVDFGTDEDGDPITIHIVAEDVPEARAKESRRKPPTKEQRVRLDALTEALLNFGQDAPPSLGLPHGTKAVAADRWFDELKRRGEISDDCRKPSNRFRDIRVSLVGASLAGYRDSFAWLVHDTAL